MYSVRNSKIKTIFRPGTYSFKHRYFIKYFKEYLSSMIMFYVIGDKNRDYSSFKFFNLIYRIFKNLFKFKFFLNYFLRKKLVFDKYDKKFVQQNLKKKFLF